MGSGGRGRGRGRGRGGGNQNAGGGYNTNGGGETYNNQGNYNNNNNGGGRGGRGGNNGNYNSNPYAALSNNGGGGGYNQGGGGHANSGNSNSNSNNSARGAGRGGTGGRGVVSEKSARDQLRDDLQTDRPRMWPLSCYAPKGDEHNLLGGDSSCEEVRWVTYRIARDGRQDPRAVQQKVDEFAKGKENDVRSILNFPNNQLKQVLEMAAKGTMAPAGLTRVIDCNFLGGGAAYGASQSGVNNSPPGLGQAGRAPDAAPNGGASGAFADSSPFGGSPAPPVPPTRSGFGHNAGVGIANHQASLFGGSNPAAQHGGFGGGGGGTPFAGGGAATQFGGGGNGAATSFGGDAGTPFGSGNAATQFGGGGGTPFGSRNALPTSFGGASAGGTPFGGGATPGGFGGRASGQTTSQPNVFGILTPPTAGADPWTASCFSAGAVPDAPPPREMV